MSTYRRALIVIVALGLPLFLSACGETKDLADEVRHAAYSLATNSTSVCGDGILAEGEQCERVNGVFPACCDSTSCAFKADATACGALVTECQIRATCQAGVCVEGGFKENGKSCGTQGDDCKGQDTCDGAGHCQKNYLKPDATPVTVGMAAL